MTSLVRKRRAISAFDAAGAIGLRLEEQINWFLMSSLQQQLLLEGNGRATPKKVQRDLKTVESRCGRTCCSW
jgi:hypothetical protein